MVIILLVINNVMILMVQFVEEMFVNVVLKIIVKLNQVFKFVNNFYQTLVVTRNKNKKIYNSISKNTTEVKNDKFIKNLI